MMVIVMLSIILFMALSFVFLRRNWQRWAKKEYNAVGWRSRRFHGFPQIFLTYAVGGILIAPMKWPPIRYRKDRGARLGIALLKAAIGVLNQVIMSVILRKQKNNSCVSTRVSYDTRSLSIRQELFFFCKDTTKRSVWLLIDEIKHRHTLNEVGDVAESRYD